MEIKGILISTLAPMDDHIANGGDKPLKNAMSIKQRPDGRVYISGQKQRHALFSAIERLNFEDAKRNGTHVSNGDGITIEIEKDLRADLGGFLKPKKGSYSGRRTAPLTATPAVAIQESLIGRDLLIRLTQNPKAVTEEEFEKLDVSIREKYSKQPQALVTREYSQNDLMLMNFFVDVGAVSIRKVPRYTDERHVETQYYKFASEEERKRRIRLALEATTSLTDYANQARNAVSGEPQQVLIVFDPKLSRKACRYFNFKTEDREKQNILDELKKRGAAYFLGDDVNGGLKDEQGELIEPYNVATAYEKAFEFLETCALFDPAGKDAKVYTTNEFENL